MTRDELIEVLKEMPNLPIAAIRLPGDLNEAVGAKVITRRKYKNSKFSPHTDEDFVRKEEFTRWKEAEEIQFIEITFKSKPMV